MTATDVLRRLLDERGVEWHRGKLAMLDDEYTQWWVSDRMEGFVAYECDYPLNTLIVRGITPEQAIAATLGSCNCSNNCTNSERTETCHITRQFTCSECGYQYPTRNFETYETCDGRTAYASLGYYVLDWKKPNYCPNCGRRCVG